MPIYDDIVANAKVDYVAGGAAQNAARAAAVRLCPIHLRKSPSLYSSTSSLLALSPTLDLSVMTISCRPSKRPTRPKVFTLPTKSNLPQPELVLVQSSSPATTDTCVLLFELPRNSLLITSPNPRLPVSLIPPNSSTSRVTSSLTVSNLLCKSQRLTAQRARLSS
jgi:hypothetical protein